jgi:hypothetical protein
LLPFHIEHVIARQHGGGDNEENLCLSCSRCNLHKGPNIASLDRSNGTLTPLYNPRSQSWKEHFEVRQGRIIGLTAVGRATVRLFRMNDARRLDLRRNLIRQGIMRP